MCSGSELVFCLDFLLLVGIDPLERRENMFEGTPATPASKSIEIEEKDFIKEKMK
jgi:hypothetical protein